MKSLFQAALELAGREREAFLDTHCRDDPELRQQVQALLDAAATLAPSPEGSPPAEDRVLGQIGRYSILEPVGSGGMGTVYRAHQHEPVVRDVAIKLVNRGIDTEHLLHRFAREREALAAMNHENIARVFDAGATEDGQPYFVMEFVSGLPLSEYCAHHSRSIEQRIRLFQQICAGVQHAHQKGVIHRDLKPANVLVTGSGERPVVKLIDFGISRIESGSLDAPSLHTQQGMLLGTPEYMSPEQASGDPRAVDARSDLYSLGVILYELLCGALPFSSESMRSAGPLGFERVLREQLPRRPSSQVTRLPHGELRSRPPRPEREGHHERRRLASTLRGDLDAITMQALAKDPDQRYASAADLSDDLARHLADLPVRASPPGVLDHLRRFARRRRGVFVAAIVVLLALTGGLTGGVLGLLDARESGRIEAAARLRERQTIDPLRVKNLVARALAPWPQHTTLDANVAEIDAWLEDADLMLGRESIYAEALRDATADLPPDRRQTLRAMIESLPRLREQRREVAGRRAILERHWPLWQQCKESLQEAKEFENVDLQPIPGLLPLGIDRDRNTELGRQVEPLWLFVAPATGEIPQWLDPASDEAIAYGTPGRLRMAEDTALVLVLIPGGTFLRGSQDTDPTGPNYYSYPPGPDPTRSKPLTQVDVSPFLISKYEVTRAQFARFSAAATRTDQPPRGESDVGHHAAGGLDWRDARDFCEWLGLTLPSETRWEYATRAGTTTPYWFGADERILREVAWTALDHQPYPRPVHVTPRGIPAPNPWGLHGVHGGLQEWCQDYRENTWEFGPPDDSARTSGMYGQRMVRGGAFNLHPAKATSAWRYNYPPGCLYANMGFRPSRAVLTRP